MRITALIGIVCLATSCASVAGVDGESDYQRLLRTCHERGGVLVPSDRVFTGRVETDNDCRISGGARRIRS
jgi:hypothetical protein